MPRKRKETPDEKRKRQTDEIHSAIGRYVEAFERTVDEVRMGCVQLTSMLAQRGHFVRQTNLMHLVFNHQSMTAASLLAIYRGLVGQILNDKDFKIQNDERKVILSVLKQFNVNFTKAFQNRNDYLHATWRIGIATGETEDWSGFWFHRAKATNDGLRYLDGPKSAKDIDEKAGECRQLADYFHSLHVGFAFTATGDDDIRVSRLFSQVGKGNAKRWMVGRTPA